MEMLTKGALVWPSRLLKV